MDQKNQEIQKKKIKKVHINGFHIMTYVKGKRNKNLDEIVKDVKEHLKLKGENTSGLWTAPNNHKKAIFLGSRSQIGLDMMEERIMELIQEAKDKVKSGELRPKPFRKHSNHLSHHSRDYHYRDDRREHRYHDDHREHRHRSHRRNPHDEAHLYRGIH